jgi:excinuclease ABC subunit A
MQWMPDVLVPCDVCNGLRYNYETLQVTWEGKSIADVLSLSVEEAAHIFRYIPHLSFKLELMQDLGLNYLALGQSFRTLSSGEIQRLRLVSDLASPSKETTLYLLDEPSAGLHFQDISKLLRILHRLVEQGHSIFMIEHHLDLLQQADWLIELGPEGGPKGGQLLFTGPPKKISETDTPTGRIFNKS